MRLTFPQLLEVQANAVQYIEAVIDLGDPLFDLDLGLGEALDPQTEFFFPLDSSSSSILVN